jgi:hypothetical protein
VLRHLGVLLTMGCVLLLGWGAAGAATPQRAVFRVALTGTLTKDWTVTRTVEGTDGCEEVTTSTGRWKLALSTRSRSTIAIAAPSRRSRPLRLSPAVVRAIAGQASQTGSVRVEMRGPRCVRSIERRSCALQRRSFRGATVRLTSPRRGTARFAPMRGTSAVRTFRADCPEEPADIRSIRTDLALADAPLAAADVFDRNVPRFFISGNSTQETTLEGDWDGKVTERVRWTLTFIRVR